MSTYILNYKDGSQYSIEIDLAAKDISISKIKAGNVRKWSIKDFGTNLTRDEVLVSYFEDHKDSEGDILHTSNAAKSEVIYDAEFFQDMLAYTNAGGILNQAKACIDVILKKRLQQTRVFAINGDFIHPVYFELTGVSPDNDPDYNNGSVTASIIQDGGYADLEVRFRIAGGAWQPWEPISTPVVKPGLSSNIYEAQVRSTGTSLMIEPVENITI